MYLTGGSVLTTVIEVHYRFGTWTEIWASRQARSGLSRGSLISFRPKVLALPGRDPTLSTGAIGMGSNWLTIER
jgi:hypothetical protein